MFDEFIDQNDTSIAVLCLSGGMDSTSLLLYMLRHHVDVFAVSFRYGQRHSYELECLDRNIEYLCRQGQSIHHRRIDLAFMETMFQSALLGSESSVPLGFYESENMKATVVPNRNAIFASIAFGYALSIVEQKNKNVAIGLGVHSGDHAIYPDCRPEFYEELIKAFKTGNWDSERVKVCLPYLNADKPAILGDAIVSCDQLGLSFDQVFANTCTSYQPNQQGQSHGMTGSDVERILAFHKIGKRDPIEYTQPWEQVLKQAVELEKEANASSQQG